MPHSDWNTPPSGIVLPGLTGDEQALLTHLEQQLAHKKIRNDVRDSYYDGRLAVSQIGTIIPPQYGKLAIVLGWSAKAVDTLADRCNLDGFVWPDGDLKSLGYQKVWDGNYFGTESKSGVTDSFKHGVSFLINTVGDEDADEPLGSIHVKNAHNATGIWDGRARRLSSLLSVTDRDRQGQVSEIALYLPGETIIGVCDSDGQWMSDRSEHPWGMPAEPMPYKYETDRPFGKSRITRSVMSYHDGALRTVIRMEGHADIYSWPEMWLLGADESLFKNADGTQKAVWQIMLGRLKVIPDDPEAPDALARADVRQFPASSPMPHIDQLKQQAQLFAGETNIPLTSLGISDMSNPTSAESYIASREDLIAHAQAAIQNYTRPLHRTMLRALAMQNKLTAIPEQWETIAPKWRSPVYLTRAASADAGMKQIVAVPWLADTTVGLELLGLDDQQIARAMSEKRRAQGQEILRALTQQAQQPPQQASDNTGAPAAATAGPPAAGPAAATA